MLNFARLIPQMNAMVEERAAAAPLGDRARESAVGALSAAAADWRAVADQIEHARTSWLLASFTGPPDERCAAPARPETCIVAAVDGSQIAYDRHEIAPCFLLNAGLVLLRYGDGAYARLDSQPTLHYRDEDLYEESEGEFRAVSARRIATLRLQSECRALAGLIEAAAGENVPAVAMMDGTLILWSLEAESPQVRAAVLADFESMLGTARGLRVPVIGYISAPGSRDVMNTLRAFRCGFENAECGLRCTQNSPARAGRPCADLLDLTDAQLFERLLAPGERSALFGSRSKVLNVLREPMNRIQFCYARTEWEIVRLEMPRWVAEDPELLDLAHSAAIDQAKKGSGYPRALTEAHEQAVVRTQDRAVFFEVLANSLARNHIPVERTRKALSKLTRSV